MANSLSLDSIYYMKNNLNIKRLENIPDDNNRDNYIQNLYVKNNILYMKYKSFNDFVVVDKYYYIYNKLRNVEETEFDLNKLHFCENNISEFFIKNILIEL